MCGRQSVARSAGELVHEVAAGESVERCGGFRRDSAAGRPPGGSARPGQPRWRAMISVAVGAGGHHCHEGQAQQAARSRLLLMAVLLPETRRCTARAGTRLARQPVLPGRRWGWLPRPEVQVDCRKARQRHVDLGVRVVAALHVGVDAAHGLRSQGWASPVRRRCQAGRHGITASRRRFRKPLRRASRRCSSLTMRSHSVAAGRVWPVVRPRHAWRCSSGRRRCPRLRGQGKGAGADKSAALEHRHLRPRQPARHEQQPLRAAGVARPQVDQQAAQRERRVAKMQSRPASKVAGAPCRRPAPAHPPA